MPNVTVISVESVLVDGEHYGAVCDTIANNPHLASDIQMALAVFIKAQKDEAEAARLKSCGELEQDIEELKTKHAEEILAEKTARESTQKELAGNIAFQQEALTRAAKAMENRDLAELVAVMEFAGASFAEKERMKNAEKAAQLRAEAAALEA